MDIEHLSEGWRRSTRCVGGDCLEVLIEHEGVSVRDSKDLAAGVLCFSRYEWARFVVDVREDAFVGKPRL